MNRFACRDWDTSSKFKGGNFEFDSLRIKGGFSIVDRFSAAAEYRFYDGCALTITYSSM
jgi:hypothetical protein